MYRDQSNVFVFDAWVKPPSRGLHSVSSAASGRRPAKPGTSPGDSGRIQPRAEDRKPSLWQDDCREGASTHNIAEDKKVDPKKKMASSRMSPGTDVHCRPSAEAEMKMCRGLRSPKSWCCWQ